MPGQGLAVSTDKTVTPLAAWVEEAIKIREHRGRQHKCRAGCKGTKHPQWTHPKTWQDLIEIYEKDPNAIALDPDYDIILNPGLSATGKPMYGWTGLYHVRERIVSDGWSTVEQMRAALGMHAHHMPDTKVHQVMLFDSGPPPTEKDYLEVLRSFGVDRAVAKQMAKTLAG